MPESQETTYQARLRDLYFGDSARAATFRYCLLVFDILTIAFFILASFVAVPVWFLVIDFAIAVVLIVDLAARFWIAKRKLRFLIQPITFADVVVIGTLLAPALIENFAFLRIMRALRLVRSYHVMRDLRERYAFVKRNEDIIESVLNLVVFVFVVTALVFIFQVRTNPNIQNYVDALYFTITTLTTTGFGDITLQGESGHLLAVVIMVLGVALFLRLVQTIFRPQKVRYDCPDCGLNRHDPDAIHCKHCGRVLHIETEGG
jgi:voltage-gated potassium channel